LDTKAATGPKAEDFTRAHAFTATFKTFLKAGSPRRSSLPSSTLTSVLPIWVLPGAQAPYIGRKTAAMAERGLIILALPHGHPFVNSHDEVLAT
jgi:hypothetical protein